MQIIQPNKIKETRNIFIQNSIYIYIYIYTIIYVFGIAFYLTTILLSHLFQHVVQSLCLQVYNKRLFLPAVQVFEKLPVTGIIKFLDTYGADLPTILACLFHDSLQYRIPYDKKVTARHLISMCIKPQKA